MASFCQPKQRRRSRLSTCQRAVALTAAFACLSQLSDVAFVGVGVPSGRRRLASGRLATEVAVASEAAQSSEWMELKKGQELVGTVIKKAKKGVFVDVGMGKQGLLEIGERRDGWPVEGMGLKPQEKVNVRVLDIYGGLLFLTMRSGDLERPPRDAGLTDDVSAFADVTSEQWLNAQVMGMTSWGIVVAVAPPEGGEFVASIVHKDEFAAGFVDDAAAAVRGGKTRVRMLEYLPLLKNPLRLTMKDVGQENTAAGFTASSTDVDENSGGSPTPKKKDEANADILMGGSPTPKKKDRPKKSKGEPPKKKGRPENPAGTPLAELQVGQTLTGKVMKPNRQAGFFVEVGAERQGLLEACELRDGFPAKGVLDGLKMQADVTVRVLEVDGDKLYLTMRSGDLTRPARTRRDRAVPGDLPVGDMIDGEVTGMTTFGVFVAVKSPSGGEPVEGLVHKDEFTRGFVDDAKIAIRGGKVKVKVLKTDEEEKMIQLTMKWGWSMDKE